MDKSGAAKIFLPILLLLTISLVPMGLFGVNGFDPNLWSLFMDWINNKPSGLLSIDFNVPLSTYIVVAYDLSPDNYEVKEPVPRVLELFNSIANLPDRISFKIKRIPYAVEDGETKYLTRHIRILLIDIANKRASTTDLFIDPKNPITTITIKPELKDMVKPELLTQGLPSNLPCQLTSSYSEDNEWTKAGIIHGISYVNIAWRYDDYPTRTGQYFKSYTQTIDCLSNIRTNTEGRGIAISTFGGDEGTLGSPYDHIVWANIRYRLWWQVITGPEMHYTIYHLDPIYIEDHYLQATNTYRGIGPWPPPTCATTITQSTSLPYSMSFENDPNDNTSWMNTDVSLTFTIGGEAYPVSVTITLYRAAGGNGYTSPRIRVINIYNWYSNTLYIWPHNYDYTSYEAWLSWKR